MLYGRLLPREQLLEDMGTLTQTYLFRRSVHLTPRKLEIVMPVPLRFMVDGDVIPDVDHVCYEVMPRGVRCCVDATPMTTSSWAGGSRARDGSNFHVVREIKLPGVLGPEQTPRSFAPRVVAAQP
jgi:hypothetical protein